MKTIEPIIKNRARQFERKGIPGMEFEDLVQEAYIWLLEHGDKFDPDKASFTSWVYCCVTNYFTTLSNRATFFYMEPISDSVSNSLRTVETMFSMTDLSEDAVTVCRLVLSGNITRLFKKEIRNFLQYDLGWSVERINITFKELECYVSEL